MEGVEVREVMDEMVVKEDEVYIAPFHLYTPYTPYLPYLPYPRYLCALFMAAVRSSHR